MIERKFEGGLFFFKFGEMAWNSKKKKKKLISPHPITERKKFGDKPTPPPLAYAIHIIHFYLLKSVYIYKFKGRKIEKIPLFLFLL